MKSGEMTETQDGIPPDTRIVVLGQLKEETLGPFEIRRMQCDGKNRDPQAIPIVQGDCLFDLATTHLRNRFVPHPTRAPMGVAVEGRGETGRSVRS